MGTWKSIARRVGLLMVGLALMHHSSRPALAQEPFPSDSSVQTLLRDLVGNGRAVGIVVGLLDSDGSRRFISFGSPGAAGLRLDQHSVFEIGSITKVFTATLLADMVRRGEVHLDDPVQTFLPPEVRVPSRPGRVITLLDIATHRSGLPSVPTNMAPQDPANPYADYSVRQLYDFLSGYVLPRDPGAEFEYSNLAVGLMGHALARRAGVSFAELVTQRILRPLRMQETGIALTPAQQAHLAHGHDGLGEPAGNWDIPTLAGAGALRSTAADMLTFAAANLSGRRGSPYEAMRDAHVARLPVRQTDSIGLNWIVSRHGDRAITWHNGGTGGYRTFLGLDLAARRAVVVLTNSGGDGCDDLGFHLLDPAVPLARPPVSLAVVQAYRAGGATAAVVRYRELKAAAAPEWRFDAEQLNTVGYWLLRRGSVADAVRIFQLNVEMYPAEWNPYDSLGEGFLALGDTAQAITNYRRSVELNPGNSGGLAVLRRLSAIP